MSDNHNRYVFCKIHAGNTDMKIKLWGVRGSIPTPLNGELIENKVRRALKLATPGDVTSDEAINTFIETLPFSVKGTYGGNTTAVQVTTDDGDIIMIDCGSGIINLGKEMLKGPFSKGKGVASVFLTHTHWDHIQGIPFFAPFYFEGNRFNFYSPFEDLKKRLEYQHSPDHFPISLEYMPATKEFFRVAEDEEFYLNDIRVFTKRMPHPGGSYGYRIEHNGSVFVYTSDCEFNIDEIDTINQYTELFHDADLALFDTQYTFEESINKLDWGHSSASIAIDIAGGFNIKHLVLFHHDPNYSDEKLDNVLANARIYQKMNAKKTGKLKVDIAYEGLEIDI